MFIAFMGIPGSGKSTTATELGHLLHATVFTEPEEDAWSALVDQRDVYGKFTALTWFRGARVSGLFEAEERRKRGLTTVVDSYYDKILARYITHSSFAWLIPVSDPYFNVAQSMAELDYNLLPNADILIFLRMDPLIWSKFLGSRARKFDDGACMNSYFEMQDVMESGCQFFVAETGATYIVYDQKWGSAAVSAQQLSEVISSCPV